MDIFINGKKSEIDTPKNNLTKILNKVEKTLINKGEIIVDLKFDGERISIENAMLKSKIETIEIITKTHRAITIESLYILPKYYDKFMNTYNSLDGESELSDITELLIFIEWLFGMIVSLKEVTTLGTIYIDYDEYVNEFRKYSEELLKAVNDEKYEEMFEILDNVMLDLIEDFVLNSADYLREIMEEEKRTYLYN